MQDGRKHQAKWCHIEQCDDFDTAGKLCRGDWVMQDMILGSCLCHWIHRMVPEMSSTKKLLKPCPSQFPIASQVDIHGPSLNFHPFPHMFPACFQYQPHFFHHFPRFSPSLGVSHGRIPICGLDQVLPEDEPELPDFESMLKPSRFAQQDTGGCAGGARAAQGRRWRWPGMG